MMRTSPDRSQPVPLIHAMGSSELEGPDGTLHRIPLVRPVTDEDGTLKLKEMGSAEWLSTSFIREVYGVDPEHLKSFRVSGNAMNDTLQPGERVRGTLWRGESLTDGAIYLLHGPTGVIARRVHLQGDTIRLSAENADVPDQAVPRADWHDGFRPLARILAVLRAV